MKETEQAMLVAKTISLFRKWHSELKMVKPYQYAEGRQHILWLTKCQLYEPPYHEDLISILEKINGEHGYAYYRALVAKKVGNDDNR